MKSIKYLFLILGIILSASCTNLEETLYDKVLKEDYGNNAEEMASLVGGVYASLRGFDDSQYGGVMCYPPSRYLFFLAECTSDEACIPTRSKDWYDNGRYQRAQRHTWKSTDIMILSAWRYAYQGIASANSVLKKLPKADMSKNLKLQYEAELRGLRAYYYSLLIDQFGNVPIVTDIELEELPANSSREEVYKFIVDELKAIIPNLSSHTLYSHFTQSVAYGLLARMYVNAEVYTGHARWNECLKACNEILGYQLEGDFFNNFLVDNENSSEIIFAIPYDHRKGTKGNYQPSMSFHYKQNLVFTADASFPGGSNGICAQPGVFSSFSTDDLRRKSMLHGEQYGKATNEVVIMDNGEPLDYTEEIHSFTNAFENEGVRLFKYEVRPDDNEERDNDWVLMRYAEVVMMKAEAHFRLGETQKALTQLNLIRKRAGLDALTHLTIDDLDREWLHEFLFEGLRRTINIRFGTFFKSWWEKGKTPQYRAIYPIPSIVLGQNEKLSQNPGYELPL